MGPPSGAGAGGRARGWLLMLFVCANWVVFSYVVAWATVDVGMPAFLLTYVANSCFLIFLPLHLSRRWLAERRGKGARSSPDAGGVVAPPAAATAPPPLRATLRASLLICPVWFLAQLAFNSAFSLTSVLSVTVLSNTAGVLTYLLSMAVLGEALAGGKVAGVLLCFAGAGLFAAGDLDTAGFEGGSALGNALVLGSAALYAVYTVGIKRLVPEGASMDLFFGLMGLCNTIFFGAVALALWASGGLHMGSKPPEAWAAIFAKGFFDNCLSELAWGWAILLLGPTVATVALTMQVPLTLLADLLLEKGFWQRSPDRYPLLVAGMALVLAGLYCMSMGLPGWVRRHLPGGGGGGGRGDESGGRASQYQALQEPHEEAPRSLGLKAGGGGGGGGGGSPVEDMAAAGRAEMQP